MLAVGGTSDASSGRDCSVAVFGQFPLGLVLQCSLSCKTTHEKKQGIKAVHLYTDNSSLPARSNVYTGSFVSLVVGSKRKTWLLLTVGREREEVKEEKEQPYPIRKNGEEDEKEFSLYLFTSQNTAEKASVWFSTLKVVCVPESLAII